MQRCQNESFLGNFYRHLAIFSGHTGSNSVIFVNQVRKTSQAALLVLLEQGLVEKSDVKEQVCPVIIRLTEADSIDDYRTEAVAVSDLFL